MGPVGTSRFLIIDFLKPPLTKNSYVVFVSGISSKNPTKLSDRVRATTEISSVASVGDEISSDFA